MEVHAWLWEVSRTGLPTLNPKPLGSHVYPRQLYGFQQALQSVPKIRGTMSGVPAIKIIVFGVYIGAKSYTLNSKKKTFWAGGFKLAALDFGFKA